MHMFQIGRVAQGVHAHLLDAHGGEPLLMVLANRLARLGALVHPCQSAFIKGMFIKTITRWCNLWVGSEIHSRDTSA
jgi:hypothetical protein